VELNQLQIEIRREQKRKAEGRLAAIALCASASLKFAIKLSSEKGASSWVTARPLSAHSTVLQKGDFRDAIYLRHGWEPHGLPEKCGCGALFDVQHSMECMVGGFRGLLHNEMNYVFDDACKEAGYKNVSWEPELQPLEGENLKYKSGNKSDEARSDLGVLGFWRSMRRAFFDVTAFSPFARSYANSSLKSLFIRHEKRKNREYKDRILNVEHGDFSPLVFSTTGGMGTGEHGSNDLFSAWLRRKIFHFLLLLVGCAAEFRLLCYALL
jgi:hypothetical protein